MENEQETVSNKTKKVSSIEWKFIRHTNEKKDINTTCPWESSDIGLARWRLNQLF